MTWFAYLLIGYWAANTLASISLMNRTMTYTPGVVITQVTVYMLLVWGVLAVGTAP